jgi:hypothetical protein
MNAASGFSINALWVLVAAVNLAFLVLVVLAVVLTVKWLISRSRPSRELESLVQRVARLESERPEQPHPDR